MSTWFSENFALGSPLRDPVGVFSHSWVWNDPGHTSQYPKLMWARDASSEVHDTNGRDGSPCLYSTDSVAGHNAWTTFVVSGTPSARVLSPAAESGGIFLDFYVKFVGSNDEVVSVQVVSTPSFWDYDLQLAIQYSSGYMQARIYYQSPNGSDFGNTGDYAAPYNIAAGHWRGDDIWHHIRLEAVAGTVTTWTPGTFVSEWNYTGGTLAVASDGEFRLYVDGSLVNTISNVPFIMNWDGQSAEESSEGSWEPAERAVEAYVNRISLVEIEVTSGSAYVDDVTVGGLVEVDTFSWIDVANFVEVELDRTGTINGLGQVFVTADAWSRDPGVTMKLRLRNVSDNTTAGESAEVTGTEPVDASFTAQLAEGPERYRLQIGSDTIGADVFAIGMLSAR